MTSPKLTPSEISKIKEAAENHQPLKVLINGGAYIAYAGNTERGSNRLFATQGRDSFQALLKEAQAVYNNGKKITRK